MKEELYSEEEEEIDEVLMAVYDKIMEEENQPGVLDINKYQQIDFTYKTAVMLMKDKDARVTYKLNQPFKSMGSVTIEARRIDFEDMEWFSRLAEFANNTEVYALTNGKIKMTFTFHGLTRGIK